MDPQFYATLNGVQERHWWYMARRTILERVLSSVFERGVPRGKLYDLGCGVGANLPVLEKFGPTLGIDMSPEAVAFCKERGATNVLQADLNHLEGVPDASGSVVVLADVIEHLDDEGPCLRAAQRALAPGGALIVTVPAYMFMWSPSDDLNHHKRRYTAGSLRRAIEPIFEIEHLTYFNTLLFAPILGGRMLEKVLKRGGDDMAVIPTGPLNAALCRVFELEAKVVTNRRLPFGVSLLCIARKRGERER
jgi:SAM-dependent methyltransferase